MKELIECFSNRSWLALLISGSFYGLQIGISTGVGIYINKFFWEWTPEVLALFPLVSGVAAIFGAILADFGASWHPRWTQIGGQDGAKIDKNRCKKR